ncbi:hypothetical protein V6N12_029833 [Hibiscus sabdariffa]|uniref:Uncharacterized protein n=1 Tax=Hibiscus sabdariffa TaxID=183260 RepID=A0ABR2CY25_9ROSI
MGLPPNPFRIIMQCITSPTMQVQWNGYLSASFRPERGILGKANPFTLSLQSDHEVPWPGDTQFYPRRYLGRIRTISRRFSYITPLLRI